MTFLLWGVLLYLLGGALIGAICMSDEDIVSEVLKDYPYALENKYRLALGFMLFGFMVFVKGMVTNLLGRN